MIRMAADWLATLRGLGESFLAVLRAELVAFQRDAAASAHLVLKGARLVVLALIFLFWMVGTLVYASISILNHFLNTYAWLAPLIVSAVLLVAAMVMRFWAIAAFRQVSGPGGLVRRHAREHADWLKDELGMSEEETDDGS